MNIFFYLIFFLFSLGQLGRVALLSGQVNFYLYESVMAVIFVLMVFRHRLLPVASGLKKLRFVYAFNLFLLFSYLFGVFGYQPLQNLVAALFLARLVFYQAFFLYLYFHLKRNKSIIEFKKGFYFSLVLITISSLVQHFLYPDLRNLIYQGWDPHLNRLFGVFFDTGLAASFYGLVAIYFYRRKNIFATMVFMTFLVLTFSRSAYLFFILTIGYDFLRTRNLKVVAVVLVLFVSIFSLVPKEFGVGVGLDRVFSIASRFEDYGKAYEIFKKAPVAGYGYNRIEFVKQKMIPSAQNRLDIPDHSSSAFSSSFLVILVTSGIVGLALFAASLYQMAAFRNLQLYFIFISLMSLSDNIILHPFILFGLGSVGMISLLYGKSR